jgi:hypothetical protein
MHDDESESKSVPLGHSTATLIEAVADGCGE